MIPNVKKIGNHLWLVGIWMIFIFFCMFLWIGEFSVMDRNFLVTRGRKVLQLFGILET